MKEALALLVSAAYIYSSGQMNDNVASYIWYVNNHLLVHMFAKVIFFTA